MYFRDVVWRNSDLEMLVHAPVPEGQKEVVSMWGWPEEWKNWNWEGNEGKQLTVSVYSRCDTVRLELNGKIIGTKAVSEDTRLTAQFEVPYQPGELVAVGLKDGKEAARQSLKTAGKPFQLAITAENSTFPGIQNELVYFNIEVLDENGVLVPDAEIPVEFEITGNGKLQAVASENPKEMQSFQQPRIKTWRGKCQLIVRVTGEGGEINVSAKSEGLKTGINSFNAGGI
jgi:beta-galactosidase